ncbi:hypothetical protein ACLB2K_077420 [Fragaria x ananassa]
MARMERIHVAIRARPLSADDAKTSPWRISGNSISNPKSSSKFEFDRVFGEDCKTSDVYQSRTKDLVAAAIDGFNGTVFAYGQTNSGKTYTIRGSATEPGVIRLAVSDLFNLIQQDVDREFLLRMSYMEIYNEEINDLLAPEHRKLQIHESIERGIYVAGLREKIVASPEQVLNLMEFGESHRHIGETNMNLYSSRSHTIFRMIIESRDKTKDEDIGSSGDAVRVSVLNLVDLAGSERAAKTGAEGVRLKEGSPINKSLMTLGTVIKKLSEGAESQGGHVPYRDSKLTRILQPALGGNANTAIICNITLAQIHADETKSSLQFASRALRVTNCAHVNEILTDAAPLKRQKKGIEELRAKLQDSHSEHWTEEILNLRNTLLQTELERERIALELEEEKKAQAEREKMVQQQAKKIENLSSMVLYSNRDENRDRFKKKRRDTWCPGNLAKQALGEVPATIISKASAINPMRPERDVRLLPFDELVRLIRKVPPRNKSLCQDNELFDLQGEYEDLLVKFETQKTCSEIQNDFLTMKLAEADMFSVDVRNDYSTSCVKKGAINVDKKVSLRQSEAILVIKRLQEQVVLSFFFCILYLQDRSANFILFLVGKIRVKLVLYRAVVYFLCASNLKSGNLYEMQTPDTLTRPENPNPKWPVPKDLIELQPSYKQDDWDPDWQSTSSSKVFYLVRRLKALQESNSKVDCPTNVKNSAMDTNNLISLSEMGDSRELIQVRGFRRGAMTHETNLDKVLVFSQFLEHIHVIEQQLTIAGIKYAGMYSPMHSSNKMKSLANFQNDASCIALLMDGSAALGLDLSFVTHVFLMEPIWDRSMEEQVISRAHRMGATHPVHVETLAMRGTIDEQMLKFLQDSDECSRVLKEETGKSDQGARTQRSLHDFADRNYLSHISFVRTSPQM